jgi:hypothetical protein
VPHAGYYDITREYRLTGNFLEVIRARFRTAVEVRRSVHCSPWSAAKALCRPAYCLLFSIACNITDSSVQLQNY